MTKLEISAKERSGMYQLLAACYLQTPSNENIKQVFKVIKDAKDLFEEIDFTALLNESQKRYEQLKENINNIEQIKQEYFDQNIVPISSSYIPPYESSIKGALKAKLNEGKKVKGGWNYNRLLEPCEHNVKLAYKAVGFNPNKLNISAELKGSNKMDHLGFELAFMAYLNDQECNNENDVNWYKLQTQFLKEHLLDFSLKYREISLERFKGFYRELADVTANFLRWDLETRQI